MIDIVQIIKKIILRTIILLFVVIQYSTEIYIYIQKMYNYNFILRFINRIEYSYQRKKEQNTTIYQLNITYQKGRKKKDKKERERGR